MDKTNTVIAIIHRAAKELAIDSAQIARTVALFDAGNTIPFVARYRKEVTGGLDEVQLAAIQERVGYLRSLEQRRDDVLRLIAEQGKLTPELEAQIAAAQTFQELEDLYLPYRPKRKTRASVAREKGLAPLAELIIKQAVVPGDLALHGAPFINPEVGVNDLEEAYAGARDIVAETVAEDAAVRKGLRERYQADGVLTCAAKDLQKDPEKKYTLYYDFSAPIAKLTPHRILAINRAEAEGALKVALDLPFAQAKAVADRHHPANPHSPFADQLRLSIEDGFKRLLAPAIDRETRAALTETAERHAIAVFAANLRPLLLQPPLRNKRVMGIDPGFRTGCKIAVVDETGKYLEGTTIYPHPPQNRWNEAKETIKALAAKQSVSVIAIGNGTASRETEQLAAEAIAEYPGHLAYVIVNEAGASVYSASEVGRREFPDLEAAQRGNVSIARRLQDPLAELVKIDPKSVGVGLYQHDVNQKELAATLDRVVESCVNFAGVDLNTASASLLQHVAGVNKRTAENVVKYREEHGRFAARDQLRRVPGLGVATFTQAAGFLKVGDGDNPLDNTFIHPESYDVCRKLIGLLPGEPEEKLPARVARFRLQMHTHGPPLEKLADELGTGVPTLQDILDNLEKPGLDPRDALPKPLLRQDVLKIEDLQPGMILQGTVRNVVDFGAFVDIGVKHDGLVHVSQLADRFVRNPREVVAVGDVVAVRVLSVDVPRGRIQLSMRSREDA